MSGVLSVTVSLTSQTMLFLMACVLGAALGVFYDLIRLTRLIFRTPAVITAVLDILFWIGALAAFSVFILVPCGGDLRFYHVLGLVLGGTLYFLTFSAMLIRVSLQFANLIKKAIRLLFRPFARLGNAISRAVMRTRLRRQKAKGSGADS